jgi:hypothetical protein
MFYDINQFPFLIELKNNVDVIINEFNQQYKSTTLLSEFANYPMEKPLNERTKQIENWVLENGFHPEQTGYDARNGEWTAFPLLKKNEVIDWYEAPKSFPKTFNLIKDIPNLNLAAFFRLASDAGTKEHKHTQKNLIFHLCLTDLDGESKMNCNGQTFILKKKGDFCLFDYSQPHSSFNYAVNERINLAIDFTPAKNFAFKS